MKERTKYLQETKKMRFIETYEKWTSGRLTQEEAAEILGVSDRTFRRYITAYDDQGLDGLIDHRMEEISAKKAPLHEVLRLQEDYRTRYFGWNVKHYYSKYRRALINPRSYTWVKNQLQSAGLVQKQPSKGKHRKRRERAAMEGMMIHQDGSEHLWVPGVYWDLIVTMDDATSEHYSMFFVVEEGTLSSFRGIEEVIQKKGLFCSFYTDRGSHYWVTPEAGGKVDKNNLTQVGKALKQLGIEMIPAYSPEARGRSERAFKTHQGRLPKELAAAGIRTLEEANRYLKEVYMPAFNEEFSVSAAVQGSAFVKLLPDQNVRDILCEKHDRTVHKNNCVSFEGKWLQIPEDSHRMHYVKAKVRVHRYSDGSLALFHGPRKLASYNDIGELVSLETLQKPALFAEDDLSFIRSLSIIPSHRENRTNHVL